MAVEANPNLLRQHAAVILARRAAIKAVRQQRKRQGLRETLPMSVLTAMAIAHLERHPELLAEAAVSPIVQNLGIVRKRRTVGREGKSPFTTHVRNGGQ
jgi:hypothetical protein